MSLFRFREKQPLLAALCLLYVGEKIYKSILNTKILFNN